MVTVSQWVPVVYAACRPRVGRGGGGHDGASPPTHSISASAAGGAKADRTFGDFVNTAQHLLLLFVAMFSGAVNASVDARASCLVTAGPNLETTSCVEVVPDSYVPGSVASDRSGAAGGVNNARYQVRAEMGNLGVLTSVSMDAADYINLISPHDVGFDALVDARANASYSDVVAVTGGGLPIGAPVVVELTFRLTGSYSYTAAIPADNRFVSGSNTAELRSTVWIYGAADGIPIGGSFCNIIVLTGGTSCFEPFGNFAELTALIPTFVGSSLNITGTLEAHSFATGSVARNCNCAVYADNTVESFSSAHTYLESLTPGVTLVAASGHDYSLPTVAPVPELSTWTSMLAGVISLILSVQRKASPKRTHKWISESTGTRTQGV